jgi:hypothetical protein
MASDSLRNGRYKNIRLQELTVKQLPFSTKKTREVIHKMCKDKEIKIAINGEAAVFMTDERMRIANDVIEKLKEICSKAEVELEASNEEEFITPNSVSSKIRKIKISELGNVCNSEIIRDGDFELSDIATLTNAISTQLPFLGNRKYADYLKMTSARAVILTKDRVSDIPIGRIGFLYPNATVGYANALGVVYPQEKHFSRRYETTMIHKSANKGFNCYIGENDIIEENMRIGDYVVIEQNCVMEKRFRIIDGGRIRSKVTVSYSIIRNNP